MAQFYTNRCYSDLRISKLEYSDGSTTPTRTDDNRPGSRVSGHLYSLARIDAAAMRSRS